MTLASSHVPHMHIFVAFWYLADYEKVLSLHHSLVNHGTDAVPNFVLVFIDMGPVDVPVAGQDGRFHRLGDLTWRRLERFQNWVIKAIVRNYMEK